MNVLKSKNPHSILEIDSISVRRFDPNELEEVRGKIKQSLAMFFVALKEQMQQPSKEEDNKKTEANQILQETLDAFDLASDSVTDPSTFDMEILIQRMRSLGRQVVELTKYLDDELGHRLVESVKLILSQGSTFFFTFVVVCIRLIWFL